MKSTLNIEIIKLLTDNLSEAIEMNNELCSGIELILREIPLVVHENRDSVRIKLENLLKGRLKLNDTQKK